MKSVFYATVCACLAFMAISCEKPDPQPIAVESVSISSHSISLTEGETVSVSATVLPDNAANKNISWSSEDNSVATVDAGGNITAVKAGNTNIIVTTEDGQKTDRCQVIVNKKIIAVQSVRVDKTELSLFVGESETLKASVNPDNADNKNISWSSSDSSIASVDANGKVTANKSGNAAITVTTEDGNHTASCNVTVKEVIYDVQSVSLDKKEITLEAGQSQTLIATINPENATNKNISWSSSDSSIASVDANGKVTANKSGNATITVTTEDGNHTASCNVFIPCHVESVSLDKTTATVNEGQVLTLVATINPSDATNKNVSWSSSNTSIATVDGSGKITAIKAGTVTITVTTEDGGKKAECTVTVKSNNTQGTGNEEFEDGGEYDW